MKGSIRSPVANELYHQKLLYQSHLKKLDKIREERKNQLALDSTRLAKQQEFRHAKSRSFAHRYNEQHQQITESNKRFLNKLQKVRPFTHHSSLSGSFRSEREQQTMTPLRRRRQEETEKQNTRICLRMRSVSSSLSKDKLLKDYAKSQQIKTRISRYATHNNKVSLKSEQFASSKDHNSLVSHYKPQDIMKNNIDNRLKAAREKRYRPEIDLQKILKEPIKPPKAISKDAEEEKGGIGVFATEPMRNWGKKKIFI